MDDNGKGKYAPVGREEADIMLGYCEVLRAKCATDLILHHADPSRFNIVLSEEDTAYLRSIENDPVFASASFTELDADFARFAHAAALSGELEAKYKTLPASKPLEKAFNAVRQIIEARHNDDDKTKPAVDFFEREIADLRAEMKEAKVPLYCLKCIDEALGISVMPVTGKWMEAADARRGAAGKETGITS